MAYLKILSAITIITLGALRCHAQGVQATPPPPSLPQEVEDNSRYKTLEANATLMKLLVNNKDGVSRSEVFDMLHSRDDVESHMDLPTFPDDSEDARVVMPPVPDLQAELLQGAPADDVTHEADIDQDIEQPPVGLAAGVMVLITVSIVCLAYTSFIVWRRIELKRNGLKHELLRNEENIAETRIEL
ncbi:hypothetical protein JYU34_006688 [Plutella xylostella]|uniref:Uncharacterized protein n=1 Tax=Plutella xylostella TaxID=51655 RepID=A0ABQ7QSL3_PLUXY|nr:hypothetical protein JYU34_006688 [Plutella xylostella]